MILRYFLARLRKSKVLTLLGVTALFFVVSVLVIAVAMPSIMDGVIRKYSRQLCGDADLMIVNPSGTGTVNLSVLNDPESDLTHYAEYINGYFMSVAEMEYNGNKELCTFFAADYSRQQSYNPIASSHLPAIQNFTDADIIIGESYAKRMGIKLSSDITHRVIITMRSLARSFDVISIAEDKSLFVAGNSILVTPKGLMRFDIPSGLVTHAFIKAKDEAGLAKINQILESEFARLNAGAAVDTDYVIGEVREIMVPIYFSAILVVVFCTFTLVVLLRLIFSRDKKNYELLRTIGMQTRHITAINALTAAIMCSLSFLSVVLILHFFQGFIRGFSFILCEVRIGLPAYLIGIGGGLGMSLVCTFLGSRERKLKPKHANSSSSVSLSNLRSKILFDARILVPASCLLMVIARITLNSSYLSFILGLLGLIVFIVALPKLFVFLSAAIHRKGKNASSLKYKTYSKSRAWQRYLVFVTIGIIVVLMLCLNIINFKAGMAEALESVTVNGENVISLKSYIASIFYDLLWIFDVLCFSLVTLVAVTVFCIIILRRLASVEEIRRLVPLGLTREKHVRHNLFALMFSFLPIFISIPFLLFFLSNTSTTLSQIFNIDWSIAFRLPEILIANVLCFIYVIISEIIICYSVYTT